MDKTDKISNLISAIKRGDQNAFKTIYNVYHIKLSAYITSFTKNEVETEDILQDTFLKLWNNRNKLDPKNAINNYLFKTAYNTYIDTYRKDKREQKILDSWKYKRLIEAVEEDDELHRAKIEKLKLVIEKLPPRCKEVFVLCKFDNMSHARIAKKLNISPKTVQAQMSYAYKLIREGLKKNGLFTLFFQLFKRVKKNS